MLYIDLTTKTSHAVELATPHSDYPYLTFCATTCSTSDIRPELVSARFTCAECGQIITDVEQQLVYTEPRRCTRRDCHNVRNWHLDVVGSNFTDWQRLRVQENADEIPAGSMPRSVDVILRHEIVERAKAGDKVIFVGTLMVAPDTSSASLGRAGESAYAVRSSQVRMLLEHVTSFLACFKEKQTLFWYSIVHLY